MKRKSLAAFRILAGICVILGTLAGVIGIIGGLAMGGQIFFGYGYRTFISTLMLGLPVVETALFLAAISKEKSTSRLAAVLYFVVILIFIIQIALPAVA